LELSNRSFTFGGEDYSGDYESASEQEEAIEAPAFEELFDEFGNALTETTFTDGEFGTIYRTFKYNEGEDAVAGNNLIEETDAIGQGTVLCLDEQSGDQSGDGSLS